MNITVNLNIPLGDITSQAGIYNDRGPFNPSENKFPETGGSGPCGAILRANTYDISGPGVLDGITVKKGDTIRALADNPGQDPDKWKITVQSTFE